jgi:hypothetical protein
MDHGAERTIFRGRGRGICWRCVMSIAAIGSGQCNNRTDDRSGRERMKVDLQYEKLNGERKQRAPRSKSNLRPNPPHRGLKSKPNPARSNGFASQTCASKLGACANKPYQPGPGGGTDLLIRAHCRGLSIGYLPQPIRRSLFDNLVGGTRKRQWCKRFRAPWWFRG